MKKIRITALIIGILLFVFGTALTAMNVFNSLNNPNFIGIIGGADAPTLWFYFTRGFDKYLPITATGFVLIVASIVMLVVEKKRKK